jgi:hypothetical protein
MPKMLSRCVGLGILLAIAAVHPVFPKAVPPPLTSTAADVPHFGNGKAKACVPLVRERIKAVMDGKSVARFEVQPPASNRPCE